MKASFGREFAKQYSSLDRKIQAKFDVALAKWVDDPFDTSLNNHALAGAFRGYRSINVTGDFRAIYVKKGSDTGVFVAIGKHSQLYR